MASSFTRSRVVIGQLAQATSRTPPSEEDSSSEYIDRSLTILGRTSDTQNERLRQEFLSQREFIATQIKEVGDKMEGRFKEVEIKMDGRFKKVERRFEEVEIKMDRRFEEVEIKMDRRFEEVEIKMDGRFKELEMKMDGRFKEVERRFEEMDNRIRRGFEHVLNVSRNGLRTNGWELISPVGSLGPRGEVNVPEDFPRTIRHFWKLKEPQLMDRLVRLARFYNIQGYEDWGRDTDSLEGYGDSDNSSQESSQSSRLPISLEVAVRSNPEIAHRVLGGQLGLAYNKIQKFMDRAKELSQARVISQKRGQDEQTSEDKKMRSFKMSPGTDVTSPTEPRSSQERPE